MNPLPLIYDLDFYEISALMESWGEPEYRAIQLWRGLYENFWASPSEFTPLSNALRQKLSSHFAFSHLNPIQVFDSADGGTRKILFSLSTAETVEAVLMRYDRRRTLCISTQVGCAMGCVFCATGQMGFRRNLSSGEIVEQVIFYARQLKSSGEHVTNIVIMGMGEPFHNYEATMQAIDRLNDVNGLNFGARRFTISTVGLVPQINRFTGEKRQVNLAISLHAADDELRSSILPVNRKYDIRTLMNACKEYVDQSHRRISFEWALIKGVNDSVEQAKKLASLLQVFRIEGSMLCHVNVIPLNPTQNYYGQAASRQQAVAFQAELERFGIPCTIRLRRGIDIRAGCGQLASRK